VRQRSRLSECTHLETFSAGWQPLRGQYLLRLQPPVRAARPRTSLSARCCWLCHPARAERPTRLRNSAGSLQELSGVSSQAATAWRPREIPSPDRAIIESLLRVHFAATLQGTRTGFGGDGATHHGLMLLRLSARQCVCAMLRAEQSVVQAALLGRSGQNAR